MLGRNSPSLDDIRKSPNFLGNKGLQSMDKRKSPNEHDFTSSANDRKSPALDIFGKNK